MGLWLLAGIAGLVIPFLVLVAVVLLFTRPTPRGRPLLTSVVQKLPDTADQAVIRIVYRPNDHSEGLRTAKVELDGSEHEIRHGGSAAEAGSWTDHLMCALVHQGDGTHEATVVVRSVEGPIRSVRYRITASGERGPVLKEQFSRDAKLPPPMTLKLPPLVVRR